MNKQNDKELSNMLRVIDEYNDELLKENEELREALSDLLREYKKHVSPLSNKYVYKAKVALKEV